MPMRRRRLAVVGFVTGAVAGSVAYRRAARRRPERVDVYFDDGTMVTYLAGSDEAAGLLPAARDALAAARA
jgi:outer membrane lipoprotein SlyB